MDTQKETKIEPVLTLSIVGNAGAIITRSNFVVPASLIRKYGHAVSGFHVVSREGKPIAGYWADTGVTVGAAGVGASSPITTYLDISS